MALPPGPSAAAMLQVYRWLYDPITFQTQCQHRFGDAFTVQFPGIGKVMLLADTDAIKQVFGFGYDDASAGKANMVLEPFLGKHSLLILDGPEHGRQRRMMMPAFHGERMEVYGHEMLSLTDDAIDAMPVGKPFALHDYTQRITLDVIVRTVFGITEAARFTRLASLLTEALDLMAWPPMLFPALQRDLGPLTPWRRFKQLTGEVTQMLLAEIRRARADGRGRSDVLSMMVSARDEKGDALSDEEVHDELITLLVAGHETTATALAWAFRWLLRDRALCERLADEIDRVSGPGPLVPSKLARNELLDGCVREALRLQPVIPVVARVLERPMRVAGHDLEAGDRVAPSIILVHRNARLYPEPHRFDPDRYRTFKPSPSEWLPFGGGIRRCIGAAFAVYEMKMVMAAMVRRLTMRVQAEVPVRVTRRSITLTPSHGTPVVVTSRAPRHGAAISAA